MQHLLCAFAAVGVNSKTTPQPFAPPPPPTVPYRLPAMSKITLPQGRIPSVQLLPPEEPKLYNVCSEPAAKAGDAVTRDSKTRLAVAERDSATTERLNVAHA
jgi:hypothetical protein